jgi:hypothetical protein
MATPNIVKPIKYDSKIRSNPTLKYLPPLNSIPFIKSPIKIAADAHSSPNDKNGKLVMNKFSAKL